MKSVVQEATASDIARHRALQEGAQVFREFFADNAKAFAEAFPDDEPRTRTPGQAA
jgi:hypothetical protein